MRAERRRDVVDMQVGELDRSIFVDEHAYQQELERIFGRAWLFIGVAAQVPNPNDFFLTYMGEDPVILCRTAAGQLKAFLNMCRHRGNRIVRADDGNAKNFMCAYHGWTFSNEGRLVSVPGLQEAYYGELDVESLGLVEVAQLDTYAGLVFATWAPDAPSLDDYLGDFRWYMDIWLNRREGGAELLGPYKWFIPNNWKNSTDNFIGDGYHAAISHRSAALVRNQYHHHLTKAPAQETVNRPPGWLRPGFQVSVNGHGTGGVTLADEGEDVLERQREFMAPDIMRYEHAIRDEVIDRLGHLRATRVRHAHASLFPNMSWLSNNVFRVWHPRGPLKTEVWAWSYWDKRAPEDVRTHFRITSMTFGPGGIMEQDDMDNWRGSSEAGRSLVARRVPSNVAMGIGHETTHPLLPGRIHPRSQGEHPQRYFYRRWQEFMNAEGWAGIGLDPRTARFEGTASLHG